jgi:hypothetical protein
VDPANPAPPVSQVASRVHRGSQVVSREGSPADNRAVNQADSLGVSRGRAVSRAAVAARPCAASREAACASAPSMARARETRGSR